MVAEGMEYHRAGLLAEAEARYRQAIAHEPAHAEALHVLGLLAFQVGQYDLAVELIGRAIKSADDRPLYYQNIGVAFQALGRVDLAIQSYHQAIALRPDYPEAFNNLGMALQAQGSQHEAVASFERAVGLLPAYAEAHANLGMARLTDGRGELAITSFQSALAIRPDFVAARYGLGEAQRMLGQHHDAVASYRAVIGLDPSHADAHHNLGVALWALDDCQAAIASFTRTIALQPAYSGAYVNLGHVLRQSGRFDEAIESYRHALELQPNDDLAHSGVILSLDQHPACTPELALAERRAWNAAHAAALTAAAPPHTNRSDPDRPLRIGYVSTNFVWNSNSLALGPILAHDPRQVYAVCYADVQTPDSRTAMFASQVPLWRNVAGWTNETFADQVRADQIDILVDLDGHSGGTHRLLTFARKPAPIQVTAWGYPTGTGLDAIDAIFADAVVIPTDEHRWYAEEVVNLPSFMCVDTPSNPPDVTSSPCARRGALTFGSFNHVMKLSAATLDTWANIVAAVPNSRMVLKYTGMDDAENVARIRTAFHAHGVGPERIDVLGKTTRQEHLAAYGSIDVQLDPFPIGGGVTTFEGLLMGVPCVTLLGDRLSGRTTASFLTTLGLTDLIAHSADEYVAIATGLAGRMDWLARHRPTFRERLLASPFADRSLFTRAAESAYRSLWRRWCAEHRA
jgi:predicted O-linked N-acetylglucosamine transferase (SPINDLY family)